MKIIIFYHLKDWYNLSYPVLFNYLGIFKNKALFDKRGIDVIDFKNFLSQEDKIIIDKSNKQNIDINYKEYVEKAFNNFVEIVRENDLYDNSILIGFQHIGSDLFFEKQGWGLKGSYDVLRIKKCKMIIWMDDIHGFSNFPKIGCYDENKDYSELSDNRLELVDKIITPSRYYFELINSKYLNKTIQYFYSLNEDFYNQIDINNFKKRENKILLSGACGISYPLRYKIKEIFDYNEPKNDKYHEIQEIIAFLATPGYDRKKEDFYNKVGIKYLETISKYKGAFFCYGEKPWNVNLAKIIEILMCGSIGFFEFSPLLEKELGLIPFKHYIPITDEQGKLIKELEYYLKYLNSEEGEKIALNGAKYVREKYSSEMRMNQLIEIIEDIHNSKVIPEEYLLYEILNNKIPENPKEMQIARKLLRDKVINSDNSLDVDKSQVCLNLAKAQIRASLFEEAQDNINKASFFLSDLKEIDKVQNILDKKLC